MIILAEGLHGLLQGWSDLGEGALGHTVNFYPDPKPARWGSFFWVAMICCLLGMSVGPIFSLTALLPQNTLDLPG